MKKLKVEGLTYLYDKRSTDGINNLSFELDSQEVLTIIGPSGSGKSTTLKLIYGLLESQAGVIETFDQKIAYVPQTTQLDETISVFEFLKKKLIGTLDEEKIENQIRSTLSILQITNEIHSKISSISGGQRQRVIIAASLVHNPDVILMDEPFGHLDQVLRFDLMSELFEIFKEKGISVIWVTHNTKEAFAFSDRIAVMNFGKIIQVGSAKELYTTPANLFISKFIGLKNVLISKVTSKQESEIEFKLLGKKTIIESSKFESKDELIIYFQNEAILQDDSGTYRAKVLNSYYYGDHLWLKVELQSQRIWVKSLKEITTDQIKFNINFAKAHYSKEL